MKGRCFVSILIIFSAGLQAQSSKMDAYVYGLLKRMTIDEKIGQLNLVTRGVVTGSVVSTDVEAKIKQGNVGGLFGLYSPDVLRKIQDIAVKESRLHIPLFFGLDVIHGHRTVFPIPLGLSCSWDLGLIEKSARIAASEATADGLNMTFSPMVDIARDPRWGRISEGSGEDPYLGSLIAKAMVKGYQGEDLSLNNTLVACVKHFALYGDVEAGRDYNSVDMSSVKMYQYYLPPYKGAIDAGAGAIMSSFNDINGIPATANKWLLTDLLRNQWRFKGLVISDYTSVSELMNHGLGDLKTVSERSFKAGLDMDMVSEGYLTFLKQCLEEGKVTERDIDNSCRRVLELKYKLGLFDDPYRYLNEERARKEIFTDENRKAAREVAAHSFVLLKNSGQLLPLKRSGKIALIGPLADNKRDILGTWVTAGNVEQTVTILEALKKAGGHQVNISYAKGANITDDTVLLGRLNYSGRNVIKDERSPETMLKEAMETADKADVIIAVLGESYNMSGEAASRSDIGIPESQKNLFKALVKTGKPVVLVLVNGRPLTLTYEDAHATAILETFAGGTEAGNAIAGVLFGDYNPSGKLTATFPRSVGQIPIYYNHKRTGRPYTPKDPEHTSDYLDISNEPLYPFGYGISYTTFAYGELKLSKKNLKGDDLLTVSIPVLNTGKYPGEEVVQLYLTDPVASITRAVQELKGFKKIMLQPGESKEISFTITPEDLKFFNSDLKYDWESGEYIVHAGTNSNDVKSETFYWEK
jgi:beta-glucosidase